MDLPLLDPRGDCLLAFDTALLGDDGAPPAPARSLVVVSWSGRVLMGFHALRRQWELPGGALEPGESALDAAHRELAEETGVQAPGLRFVAWAQFEFGAERARHIAAVFHADVADEPTPTASPEMTGFRWWRPGAPPWPDQHLLDAEVARRCASPDA